MASWMVHLRICDGLLDSLANIDHGLFAAGCIGADCGVWQDRGFSPPQTVTHFSHTGKKGDIRHDEYFDTFVSNCSSEDFPFYLGYYVHLLTDLFWVEDILYPDMDKYADRLSANPEFVFEIKRDWYDLDRLFLRDNPDFRSFGLLCGTQVSKPYHIFYTTDLINGKIAEIIDFYRHPNGNPDREYTFLSKERMDEFVEKNISKIADILRFRNVIIG